MRGRTELKRTPSGKLLMVRYSAYSTDLIVGSCHVSRLEDVASSTYPDWVKEFASHVTKSEQKENVYFDGK
jgi:hypothetical protein